MATRLPQQLVRSTTGGSLVEYAVVGALMVGALGALGRTLAPALRSSTRTQADHVATLTGPSGSGATGEKPSAGPPPTCTGGLCKGGFCFVAGTPVATPAGPVPIERLRAGDLVLSRDEATGVVRPEVVTATTVTPDMPLVDVAIRRRGATAKVEHVVSTPGHLYWTPTDLWVRADRLRAGDVLLDAQGAELEVEGAAPLAVRDYVYNLDVADHSYFVGDAAAWVHNPDGFAGSAYALAR